ncbi:hypothetical protein N8I77_013485 [Diaporthe amygdali]|uniref:2EXR domain-containing protein n=1 Tax=Phomopsis amygdali TaxID=1214568 RepID=A0AAD9S4D5_PHOAM|nr:hypothetical protein N8I77_013485 [Diaporthe amygdali]
MSDLDNAMYPLLSFKYKPTTPAARNVQLNEDDRLRYHDDKLRIQALSMNEISELSSASYLVSRLPALDVTMLSNLQTGLSVSDVIETPQRVRAVTEAQAQRETEVYSTPGPTLTNFHIFGYLPAELRVKIWILSFLSRVVELHPTWPNNVVVRDDGRQHQWQSGCNNPAALSVCSEAREIALGHFRIAYPLISITNQRDTLQPFTRYATEIGTDAFHNTNFDGK